MKQDNNEIFVDVEGYEGLYKVSNLGRVYGERKKNFLRFDTDKDGYKITTLSKNSKQKKIKVHRLVYHTFFPDTDKSLQINHLNRTKDDNRLCNLEPVNNRENNSHKFKGKKTTSRFTGVTKGLREGTWRAQIQINKHKQHLGNFNCETAAYIAFLKKLKTEGLTNKYA